MFDLAQISYRVTCCVSFGYRNAGDRFSTIIHLLYLNGIKPSVT